MKTLLYACSLMLVITLMNSCQVESKPVPYGAANCAHCNMTVADNRYGAELVNDKGKAYFFDSSECLMAYLNEQPEQNTTAAFLLVTDFTRPNELINARTAQYLQSKSLPSPMGLYLTAIGDKTVAANMQREQGGRLLSWNEALLAVHNNERPE